MNISIRNETEGDRRRVEEVTREAFWNLYVPGCNEHYLVHVMREHPDFIPQLDLVALHDNGIVGNIMYTKSCVLGAKDPAQRIETITFGPVSVLPEFQRQGIGSALIRKSISIARENKFKAIIILGSPLNYCKHGFKNSKDLGICDPTGKYPYGQLVLELEGGVFRGHEWKYYYSDVYNIDQHAANEYDRTFVPKKKEFKYSQEEFSIAVRAYLA